MECWQGSESGSMSKRSGLKAARSLKTYLTFVTCVFFINPVFAESWTHGGASGKAMVCKPDTTPPYPAVVYNHGHLIDSAGLEGAARKGYDLRELCDAFAQEGYLAFILLRQHGDGKGKKYIRKIIQEARQGLAAAKARPDVDPERVALGGFSRGGFLTLTAATQGVDVAAAFMLAPGMTKPFHKALSRIDEIKAPMFAMIAKDDESDFLKNVSSLENAANDSGKELKVHYYPSGEHALFYNHTKYLPELVSFLNLHLGK